MAIPDIELCLDNNPQLHPVTLATGTWRQARPATEANDLIALVMAQIPHQELSTHLRY